MFNLVGNLKVEKEGLCAYKTPNLKKRFIPVGNTEIEKGDVHV